MSEATLITLSLSSALISQKQFIKSKATKLWNVPFKSKKQKSLKNKNVSNNNII